eukprot:1411763-Amphidinium_carterae.1
MKGESGPPCGPPSRMWMGMSLICFHLRKRVLGRSKSWKKRNRPPLIPEVRKQWRIQVRAMAPKALAKSHSNKDASSELEAAHMSHRA